MNVRGPTPFDEELFPYPNGGGGVLATREILDSGVHGVGDQFRAGAETYDERYFQVDSKIEVLRHAFGLFGMKPRANAVVLDIGCGSGNATFATLKILPGASVYATDLSPEMTALLARRATGLGLGSRITAFVANASKLTFEKILST